MQLASGGAPLSAGQKQLVALSRALLQHSKVRMHTTCSCRLQLLLRLWALFSICLTCCLCSAKHHLTVTGNDAAQPKLPCLRCCSAAGGRLPAAIALAAALAATRP